jgi:hypothetical protein
MQMYTPGPQNQPFGLANTNPQGSNYPALSSVSPVEENLIAKEIQRLIFDAAPAQYNALKIIFQKEFEEVGSDEFEYLEQTFNRTALQVDVGGGAIAVAGVANTAVTQSIDITAATLPYASVDLMIVYPTNEKGTITNIVGNTLTITSITGQGLPAINDGDSIAIMSSIDADGRDVFTVFERTETITRFNFIHLFLRARRWDRVELVKWQNMGTTNYLDIDRENLIKALRTDMFNILFNGYGGEAVISSGDIAKTMWGIFPSMTNAGSANASTTLAGLQSTFETLALQTNFKAEGAVRFIYGTQEILHELSKVYKVPGLRYAPNDYMANLNLKEYEFGGMRFVPVPCELFREPSCFPASWARRLLVLDQDTIQPVKMKGIAQFEMGGTLTANSMDGSRERFKDWYVRGNLSLKMNNPLSSFYIDVP